MNALDVLSDALLQRGSTEKRPAGRKPGLLFSSKMSGAEALSVIEGAGLAKPQL